MKSSANLYLMLDSKKKNGRMQVIWKKDTVGTKIVCGSAILLIMLLET